jgi:hypothetical protein
MGFPVYNAARLGIWVRRITDVSLNLPIITDKLADKLASFV